MHQPTDRIAHTTAFVTPVVALNASIKILMKIRMENNTVCVNWMSARSQRIRNICK